MTGKTFDELLLSELAQLFTPVLVEDAEQLRAFLARIGWNLDNLSGLDSAALLQIVQALGEVVADVIENESTGLADVLAKMIPLISAFQRLAASLQGWTPPAGLPPETAALLAEDAAYALVDAYLQKRLPAARGVLALLGIVVTADAAAISTTDQKVVRGGRARPKLRFDRIGEILSDPLSALLDPTGSTTPADTAGGLADLILPIVSQQLLGLGLSPTYGGYEVREDATVSAEDLAKMQRILVLPFWAPPSDGAPGDPLILRRLAMTIAPYPEPAGDPTLMIASSGDFAIGVEKPGWSAGLTIHGLPDTIRLGAGGLTSSGSIDDVSIGGWAALGAADAPGLQIGRPDGPNFSIATLRLSANLDPSPLDVTVALTLAGMQFSMGGGGRDSFMARSLPGQSPALAGGDLELTVSIRNGFSISGDGRIAHQWDQVLSTPIIEIGPVTAGIGIGANGVTASVTATIAVTIGPMAAVVEEIGLEIGLRPPPPGSPPSLAPSLRFAGPKGVALAVAAGPVVGAGYIVFDNEAGEYAGALYLSVKAIAITAVCVVNTKLPESPGTFSFLVIITCEFPPIQLGYGFALMGVGGLAGINRDLDADVLRDRMRAGALNSILFPRDPILTIRTIIDDVKVVFPPKVDRFVFGPMVKIGWGPNALIEIDVAVVLTLPSPILIVLLGRIRIALPTKEESIVDLRLDVMGILDFGRGRITIDAYLIDSRIAAFTVTGGMSMEVSWGATKIFVLTVGGFAPRFIAPPSIHPPPRLAISMASGDSFSLSLSTYFAITSNSLQFGAGADVHAGTVTAVGQFSVDAYMRFDALMAFDPFKLNVDLTAGVDVKSNGATLLQAQLVAGLSGPGPWRGEGVVGFTFIVAVKLPFAFTIGDPAEALADALLDLLDILTKEIARPDCWTALPAAIGDPIAAIRDATPDPGLVLAHPLGGIGLRQRAAPLGLTLTRFGATPLSAPARAELAGMRLGGRDMQPTAVFDDFAPGMFSNLTDDEKISRPAFEAMQAGGEATAQGVVFPVTVTAPVDWSYQETVLRAEANAVATDTGVSTVGAVGWRDEAHGARTFARGVPRYEPAVSVSPERYHIVDVATLQTGGSAPLAYAQCAEALRSGAVGLTAPAYEVVVTPR